MCFIKSIQITLSSKYLDVNTLKCTLTDKQVHLRKLIELENHRSVEIYKGIEYKHLVVNTFRSKYIIVRTIKRN